MTRLDPDTLTRLCSVPPAELTPARAAQAAAAFGAAAAWWLRGEVLARAAARNPAYAWYLGEESRRLPGSVGSCWVPFALSHSPPLLRRALLLPLQWRPGSSDSPLLPPPLRGLAAQVRGQLGVDDYGLHLHPQTGLDGLDLSGLDGAYLRAGSGWAALAGGLALAADGLNPDPGVWASAAWDPDVGVGGVDEVEAKLGLAAEWGARVLYLPAENQAAAFKWRWQHAPGLEVKALRPEPGSPGARKLLAEYLGELGQPPDPSAPFERRRRYYEMVGKEAADRYYWSHLLGDAADRCREGLQVHHPACRPTHLVTVVSHSPATAALALAASGAARCLLLYDGGEDAGIAKALADLQGFASDRDIAVTAKPIRVGSREAELAGIGAHLGAFTAGVPPGSVLLDLTPGFKPLSLALRELARPGDWLLYCRHRLLRGGRVEPGTELFEAWRA